MSVWIDTPFENLGYQRNIVMTGLIQSPRGDLPMASDIFAKIGDIKGESRDARHKDEIDVLSFSWGVASSGVPASGAGGGAGKPAFQDLSIVHNIDKASPLLIKACATGTHLKEAIITHRKAGSGQHEYLVVKLNDVIITDVSHTGTGGQPAPETVSLSFGKVDFEYRFQRPDGSLDAPISFKFDLKTNQVG